MAAEPPQVEVVLRGNVSITDVQRTGGQGDFSVGTVRGMVSRRVRAIQSCYERELRSDPTIAGRVKVTLRIEETGAIGATSVAENTTGSDATASCVQRTVRRFRFNPGPVGGSVEMALDLTFSPQPR